MSQSNRIKLIKEIEQERESIVICHLTTLRQNVPGQIADDQVRILFDHLLFLHDPPVERIDLYICSNGGSGTVPWRIVALIREFAKEFNVLIPYRAYSAASLLALGADNIVMHPFAEMGPIDPTVANDFNPVEHGRRLGISIEDVKAYINFVKSTVGITHDDELIKAVEILANRVHPLALGNVERFLSQSRLIARKVLKTHKNKFDDRTIEEIVENMASKLFFHGHPINRKEAKEELQLKVRDKLSPTLERAMWNLYMEYEKIFRNSEPFNPVYELAEKIWPIGASKRIVDPGAYFEITHELLHALIETTELTSELKTKRRYRLAAIGTNGEPIMAEDILSHEWIQSSLST